MFVFLEFYTLEAAERLDGLVSFGVFWVARNYPVDRAEVTYVNPRSAQGSTPLLSLRPLTVVQNGKTQAHYDLWRRFLEPERQGEIRASAGARSAHASRPVGQ